MSTTKPLRLLDGSRMSREAHVRFCEGLRVKFPRPTRRNIYLKNKRAGQRVMGSITNFLETKLKLKVNLAKSAVDVYDYFWSLWGVYQSQHSFWGEQYQEF